MARTAVSVASTAPTTDRWNLAAVEVIPAATPIQSYGYTTEGRLTTATTTVSGTTTGQYTYCYDPNGNLTSAGTALGGTCPGTAPFTYDGANEILTQPYGTHDTYDLDGNETNTDSAATGPAAQRQTAYSNGSQATTVTVGAGPTLGSTYLSNSNTERYTSATSATNTDSTLTSPLGISAITHSAGGPTLYITRDPQGGLISARVGPGPTGTKYYYQTDRLGNVLRVVNATGQATNTYTYTPYGQTTANQTLTQPFGYTSGYRDPATGLLKLGARYYDPTQNRFTQPDPTGQNPGYMYAGDDPINSADPNGLDHVNIPDGYEYDPSRGSLNDYCTYSPDQYYGFLYNAGFRGACASHDVCYRDANSGPLQGCNDQFFADLNSDCDADIPLWDGADRIGCFAATTVYFQAVTVAHLGQD